MRSASSRVCMTKALLESVIQVRQRVADAVPSGAERDGIVGSLEELFEQGVKMAKHRIDGEKTLSAKIHHLQHSFFRQIKSVEGLLGSLPTPDLTLAEVEQLTEATASMHTKLTRLEAVAYIDI